MTFLEPVLVLLIVGCGAAYLWAWHRVLTRIEKHDNTWYDSFPMKEVIARYIEVFGPDRIVSFVWPRKVVRVTLGAAMVVASLLLFVTFFPQ